MAKKKVPSEEPVNSGQILVGSEPVGQFVEIATVSYDDLMTAKVQVVKDGVVAFYLDPARGLGNFVLRPVPQPAEEGGEIPNEWRRPTAEEAKAAAPKIDWDIPGAEEPAVEPVEGEEPTE